MRNPHARPESSRERRSRGFVRLEVKCLAGQKIASHAGFGVDQLHLQAVEAIDAGGLVAQRTDRLDTERGLDVAGGKQGY